MGIEEVRAASVLPKRSGLGRGFGSVLAAATDEPAPAHVRDASSGPAGFSVAVTETNDGTVLTVSDASGRSATARTTWTDSEQRAACVAAVADLLDLGDVTLVSAAVQTVAGTEISSVLVETGGGQRVAGSEIVAGTSLYATARAVHTALLGSQR